jgi:hypothetical protein
LVPNRVVRFKVESESELFYLPHVQVYSHIPENGCLWDYS